MQNEIKILTYGGRTVVKLDDFLPASKKNLRQIFKMLNGDLDHRMENLVIMEVYCSEKREELLEMLNSYATSASNYKREADEMDPLIRRLGDRIGMMKVKMQSKDLIRVESDRLIQLKKTRNERVKKAKACRESYRNARIKADRLKECEDVIRNERGGAS